MSERGSTSAIVIGAGIAGLVTARVLADHVDQVTILERDHLPGEPVVRRGVPQGRHARVQRRGGVEGGLRPLGHQLAVGREPGAAR